jgi:two-component system, LytTR family, response regulator
MRDDRDNNSEALYYLCLDLCTTSRVSLHCNASGGAKLQNVHVLIVDDEPLARASLANLLMARGDVRHFDLAGDAVEALDRLTTASYDLVLFDINMPELSGMEFLERVNSLGNAAPSVIFVATHEEFAMGAGCDHAVGYVLKPFSESRMNEAISVALKRSEGERAVKLPEPQFQKMIQRSPERIAIKTNGRILFIKPEEVLSVHAEGNYVLLQGEAGTYLLRESISTMAEKLEPYGFIRIHRSVLVNTCYVVEVHPHSTGDYCLRLRGGKEFRVTRSYKTNLKALATSWIGTDGFLEV